MGQNTAQYLPGYVTKWYHMEEDGKPWWLVVLTTMCILGLILGGALQSPFIFHGTWIVSLVFGGATWLCWSYAKHNHEKAVFWVDYQTERYNLRPVAFDWTTCHHVLACIAWTLHYCKPGDSKAVEMAKRDLRHARGVMELLYGDEVRNAGLMEITVRDLCKKFPLGVVLEGKLAGQELLDLARVRAKEVGVTIAA